MNQDVPSSVIDPACQRPHSRRNAEDMINMKLCVRRIFPLLLTFCILPLAGFPETIVSAGDTAGNMVPLNLKLPAPAFLGTPQNVPIGSDVEPMSTKPRPPLMVPEGLKNLAPGSVITCSDTNTRADALAKITDGDKQAADTS